MVKILDEVLKLLPKEAKISEACFEASNIVLYTKNKDFLINPNDSIKKIVDNIKKRVELRADPSMVMDMEDAKKIIEKEIPKEAGTINTLFDPQRSVVIIEAEKPGIAIGKGGELLKELKKKILWVPIVRRIPPIRSHLIESIRSVLYENSEYRRKFLNEVGKRIYSGWIRGKKEGWVRISFLGAGREVGRSCLFLQTPESRILMDCGINVASEEHAFPHLDAPEFNIQELDAVIISHPHLDHCLHPTSYVQLADGTITKIENFFEQKNFGIKCLDVDDSLNIEDWKCFQKVKIPSPKNMYKIKTKSKEITVTGDHRFFLLDNDLKIIDKKTNELKKGDFIATPKKIPFTGKTQKLDDIVKIVTIDKKGREILVRERIRRRLKQSDIAKKIGCTQTTISFIETNKNPSCNMNLLKKLVDLYGLDDKFIDRYSNKKENKSVKIKFPKKTDEKLLQILGYLIGDGFKSDVIYKGKRIIRIALTDKNVSNLKFYQRIIKNIFDLNGRITIKDRNRLTYYSPLLLDFINKISNNILCRSPYREIPEIIHKATKKEIAGFLRGLYDAEGSVGDHHIVLTSTSENIIKITQMLLLRYEINSHIYERNSYKSKRKVYQLSIYNPKSINLFYININFNDLNKKYKLEELRKKIGNACAERMDLIPLNYYKLLDISKKLKLRRIDLENYGIQYYHYLRHNPTKKKLRQILKIFKNRADELNIKLNELDDMRKLVNSDILWDPIVSIQETKSDCDFVYDLKVAGHHNYIANGIIVHNCGFLPYLFKYGYRGPVYCTAPTRDIGALLSLDYIAISQKEAKESAYTTTDVKNMVLHTIPLEYEEVSDITPDVRLTLYNAGHNLGSSLIHLHIGNGLHNLLYTADFNFETSNLLSSAITKFPRLETVITEATYGSQSDITPTREESEQELIRIIKDTIEKKGKVLMPTLGVGRSQEVMLILERALREGLIPKIPIYLHGMLWDVTAIHTTYPDFFNKQVKKSIFQKDENPLLSEVFKRVGSQKEMEQVISLGESCVIMATSGMLTGGASLEYFKALAENPNNELILTSYQGEGSLGRRLQNGEKEILFMEGGSKRQEITYVKIGIHTLSGFSGHSNFNQLINFFKRLDPKPRKIIINHGESSKCLEFASTLHQMLRIETLAPRNLEAVRLK